MKAIVRYKFFLLLLLIIILTRLLVFNTSAKDFFGDERHYSELINTLQQSSSKNDYMIAVRKLFELNARPGLGLIYYPAAILEWKNPTIPFGFYFNAIINVLSMMILYLIVKKNYANNAAFLATLFTTFSISSLIYTRHLIPYDIALFVFLLGLYIYFYFRKILIFGLFAGLFFMTYPGYYYYLMPIPFILLIYYRSFKKALFFLTGFALILLFTHLCSLVISGVTPYFTSLRIESGGAATANYGEFIPAWSYIGEYIKAVDGSWNILLMISVFPGFFLIKEKKIRILLIYLAFIFLILESYSHIMQKTVLFGRTVRPFYLTVLVLSAIYLERMFRIFKNRKYYFFGICILITITVLNFLPRFFIFKNLIYPKEFIQQANVLLSVRYEKYSLEEAIFVNYWNTKDPPKNFYKSAESGKFYTVNAVQMFPYFGNYDLGRYCSNEILLKEPHIQFIFRPYLFEGHKRIMREKMTQDPLYYFLIYCK